MNPVPPVFFSEIADPPEQMQCILIWQFSEFFLQRWMAVLSVLTIKGWAIR